MSMRIGDYEIRFLLLNSYDKYNMGINDPLYLDRETHFRDWNIFDYATHDHEAAPTTKKYSSWLLARLWFLSQWAIALATNADKKQEDGSYRWWQDGGSYFIEWEVLYVATGERVAIFYIEGFPSDGELMSWFVLSHLRECDRNHNPEKIIEQFADLVWSSVDQVSICKIQIDDPEQNRKPHYYGYDGENYF